MVAMTPVEPGVRVVPSATPVARNTVNPVGVVLAVTDRTEIEFRDVKLVVSCP
jgi:hypothetical protein